MGKNKWYKAISIIMSLAIVIGLLVNIVPRITTTVSAADIPPNWWLDANLSNGLWYQDINNPIYVQATPQSPNYQVSFMKIYSGFVGQPTLRVMELSTYPRAYVDKDPHVYQVDTPFVVGIDDLNYYDADGNRFFRDTRGSLFTLGQTAYHWAGDPLPGSFPMWLESETLPTPKWVDSRTTVFPAVFQAVKGQLVNYQMYEAYYRGDTDTTWVAMPADYFAMFVAAFSGTDPSVKLNAKVGKDRLIIRVIYDRIISP